MKMPVAREAWGQSDSLGSRWQIFFLTSAGILSSTILLKVGQIQYLEIIYLLLIGVLLFGFARHGFRAALFRPFVQIGLWYGVFAAIAFVLSLASLRFQFYYPDFLDLLKHPVLITLSRLVELAGSVSAMLYMAHMFRSNVSALRFTMRLYFWTGIASTIYSILSYPLEVAGLATLGAYSGGQRFRGFYNEGGPYGVYLISVFVVGVSLYSCGWERPRRLVLAFVPFIGTFVMAWSKAAYLAVVAAILLNVLLARGAARRALLITSGITALFLVFQIVDFAQYARTYRETSAAYERLSHLHAKDPSFVYGRLAGAFIMPRMLIAHPLTGVGWGNYGILRNAPEYRGAAAWADTNDDPGLGLLGSIGELGVPLLVLVYVCLSLPYFYLRRVQAPYHVINLALLQPVAHTFGAQLNLTYPWIVTAFALGLGYALRGKRVEAEIVTARPDESIAT